MKQIYKQLPWSALMGLVVPSVCLGIATGVGKSREPWPAADTTARNEATVLYDPDETGRSLMLSVLREDGTVSQLELEDYLTGVVLAEMPSSFESEALKAQAVVARTYTMRRYETGGKHEEAVVCSDAACCQGYLAPDTYLNRGGSQAGLERIRAAVRQTGGIVLTYEGELIEATYFSCSGGTTEDALAVWGTDVPYLQSTSSPGEEDAAHYTDTAFFTKEEFMACVDTALSGSPLDWLGKVTYTTGGGVDTIQIGERTYRGTEVRAMLGLRSTDFTMTATEQGISVVTHGYGHRVGMSQYGADAMAVSGSDYGEILAHYYEGTSLETYSFDEN